MDIKQAAPGTRAARPTAESAPVIRRRLFAAGASGVAVSLLPWLGNRASAAPKTVPPNSGGDTTTTATTVPAPTTTAPPKRPTAADTTLLQFAQTIELAIRDLYDVALGAKSFEGATAKAITAIREAHEAYAQSISGIIGGKAPGTRSDKLFSALRSDFTGNAASVARAAANLENIAVATHTDILGALVGIDAAALIASIIVVESRHATVLNTLAGATKLSDQLASDGAALSPSDYPVK